MAQSVTICGPNLYDQSKGEFHVHAAGCADLVRHARREPEYANGWTIEATSREDIVRAIYADHIEEAERENAWVKTHPEEMESYPQNVHEQLLSGVLVDWRTYDDLYIFPCVHNLPDEAPKEMK